MEVLFIGEKWCDGDPNKGLTNSYHNLYKTLEQSNLATYNCMHFDEYHRKNNQLLDNHLLRYCYTNKPNCIVITPLIGSPLNISMETLRRLFSWKIPLVFIWFDAIQPFVQRMAEIYSSFAKLNVLLDTPYTSTRNPHKFIHLWTPQDSSVFCDTGKERDIPISFLGTKCYNDRRRYLSYLKSKKIKLTEGGGQRENPLDITNYADIMQRSKIVLNFSKNNNDSNLDQLKGRIFEAMLCGSLLLESENLKICNWYKPYVHYIPFSDEKDLLAKVDYYLRYEDARRLVANNGKNYTLKNYNHIEFWKRIFSYL